MNKYLCVNLKAIGIFRENHNFVKTNYNSNNEVHVYVFNERRTPNNARNEKEHQMQMYLRGGLS